MEITEVFRIIEKQLDSTNKELEFKKDKATDESISFSGEKGIYRIVYDSSSSIMAFECAYENSENAEFNTISRSLFDAESYDERDAKSLANEINDEITSLFKSRKKVDLDKIKMPKAVSRTKAKNGVVSYDTDSLANRFATLYPDMKDDIRANIAQYGEFLPETFFMEKGSARIIDVIANGSETDVKKLFKMLNEVYEDGTNEVQDIIGVTILGEMKNDPKLMEVADKYMSDYMSGPVHEINKITAKNNSLTKKLKNPPPYKPKKKRKGFMQNALQSQDLNNR
ncbi:MAG TPA: hypothetical protein IAA24_04250 [Candidatus Eubacterium faecigallinarum]|nr:hypothetical protein [Candidatus Eubacterium faecigallinarum]